MRKGTKKIHYTQDKILVCTCGNEALGDTFTWADLGGHMVLLCWSCTDTLHKNTLAKERERGLV